MFRGMCVRNKIIITVAVIVLINLASVMILINSMEKKLIETSKLVKDPFTYDYFLGMILTGDLHASFLLNKDYPMIKGDRESSNIWPLLRKLKLQILAVFGFSITLGVGLSILISRSITKPVTQLARTSQQIANGELDAIMIQPRCPELRILADSFTKMQKGLLEYEEEKSRKESVEITKHLAAGIAHEIKNPVNTVGLILDYLQSNLSPDNPEKRYEFYKLSENMKNELKRINKIVEGFLRLTKPDAYSFRQEDLNAVIKNSISILEPEVVRHSVRLNLNLSNDLPPVMLDCERFNQVISNLVINAVEAMPWGGDINISTDMFDGKARIKISDTGIGIPEDNLKKIFNPYYTTKKQGFGLGLSLIHNIIQKHQGRITVKSEKGKGTEFVIHLPVDYGNESKDTGSR